MSGCAHQSVVLSSPEPFYGLAFSFIYAILFLWHHLNFPHHFRHLGSSWSFTLHSHSHSAFDSTLSHLHYAPTTTKTLSCQSRITMTYPYLDTAHIHSKTQATTMLIQLLRGCTCICAFPTVMSLQNAMLDLLYYKHYSIGTAGTNGYL